MQNKTIITAIELGYNLNDTQADTLNELHEEVMCYLYEHCALLDNQYEECQVTSHGNTQNVSFGDFTSSGHIVDWSEYYFEKRQRINHSDFVHIEDDGTPVLITLWCWSQDEEEVTNA
jgi:hypothetical protein